MELKRCSDLREVSLESNRLTTPVMDLRALSKLESLQLYGNPLEFLPELSPCTNLRHLSLANVRIAADEAFTQWDVDVTATSYISRGSKLAQLFALIFRRSSCQQPLLAGALGRLWPIHVSVKENMNLNVSLNVNVFVNVNVHEMYNTADALRVCALPILMLHLMYCMRSSKVSQNLDMTMVKPW